MTTDSFLYEHMIRAETEEYICRIWRQAVADPFTFSNDQLKSAAIAEIYLIAFGRHSDIVNALNIIAKHEHVNSVEIINRKTGDGLCVHKNWP